MRYMTLLSLTILVQGCGVVYQSPAIRSGMIDGTKVRVVEVTPETVLAANSQAYSPRSLPAAFRASAGTGGSSMGASALPEPVYQPETRPAMIETRLPPAPASQPYRIGVGDVVLLATKAPADTVSELSGLLAAANRRQGYTVQDDGAIAIPDVGRVRIADMTLEEAEQVLFQRLLERQIDPTFSLEVAMFNARKVSIGGNVVSPGVAPITLTPLTLDNALASVGGLRVSERNSSVIRIYREGKLYQLPVEQFLTNAKYQKLRLVDGDSVFVDSEYDLEKAQAYFQQQIGLAEFRAGARTQAMQALTNEVALRRTELEEQRTNFASRLELGAEKRDYVYVSGEVGKQGRWALPYEQKATLADALYDQGGVIEKTGNPRQVYVLRGSPDPREFGGLTAWHVDGGTPAGMVLATRLELRPDDVIYVAEQPITKWSRVMDQLTPSLVTVPLNNATRN